MLSTSSNGPMTSVEARDPMSLALSLLSSHVLADVSVGDHVVRKVAGLTLNMDTVWATVAAGVVTLVLGLVMRARVTAGVPGKMQLVWELGVTTVKKQVESNIGPRGARIVPLAITLFVFILVSNVFAVVGLGSTVEWLPAPTADINLPLAMAVFVIILVHIASIRSRGIGGYVKHYLTQPFPLILMPFNLFINLVEEIAKPLTLALRLFGNLLSSALMLSLLAFLVAWKLGAIPVGGILFLVFDPVWKLFDLVIGAIQAFIFALLTILYFDTAMSDVH
jgi:F-type H+-transporting ATPase subunit a